MNLRIITFSKSVFLVTTMSMLGLAPKASSASANKVQPAPEYPVKKSANGRYLVDAKGAPFLIAGDARSTVILTKEIIIR